jgi:hypothetical protein
LVALGALAPAAWAPDHLMLVNEVFPSSTGSQQFVELKDPSAEPYPFPPYILALHGPDGSLIRQQTLTGDGYKNTTAPYLIANSTPRDQELTVDPLPADGGQLCFYRGGAVTPSNRINCLGYGNVTMPLGDTGPLPPAGQSLQRLDCGTIGPAVPTRDAENAACSSGGGGGGGGGGGSGSDDRPPAVRLRVRKRQDVDKVAIVVRSDEPGKVTVRASVRVGRRTVRFKTVKRALSAGVRKKLRLRLARKAKRRVKRSLARGRSLRAKVKITVADAAGNATVKRARIRLRD